MAAKKPDTRIADNLVELVDSFNFLVRAVDRMSSDIGRR